MTNRTERDERKANQMFNYEQKEGSRKWKKKRTILKRDREEKSVRVEWSWRLCDNLLHNSQLYNKKIGW